MPVYPFWQDAKTVSADLTGGLIRSRWTLQSSIRRGVWRDEKRDMWFETDGKMTFISPVSAAHFHLNTFCWMTGHHCTVCIGLHTQAHTTHTDSHSYWGSYLWCFVSLPQAGHSSSKSDCSLIPTMIYKEALKPQGIVCISVTCTYLDRRGAER